MTAYRSTNDLIRPLQQRLRDVQAERLRGLEVDDQLKLRRLLDGQVARLGALEDLVDEDRRAPPDIVDIRAVGDQPAGLDVLPVRIHRGEPALGSLLSDLLAMREKEPPRGYEESTRASLSRPSEGILDLASIANLERQQLPAPPPGGGFGRLPT